MTANKMPVMPEAVWIVLDTPGADFDWSFVRTEVEAREFDSDDFQPTRTLLYTADQMRAMYLAGIAAARDEVSGLPNEWRELVRNHYGQGPCGDALLHCAVKLDDTLANLTALEQEAKK